MASSQANDTKSTSFHTRVRMERSGLSITGLRRCHQGFGELPKMKCRLLKVIYKKKTKKKHTISSALFFYNFISKYPHLYISKQYILHTFIIYFEREREREVLFNTFRFSFLCKYSTISFVWVTYVVWCKSTSVFVAFLTSRLIVGIRIGTYMYDLRNCFIHHYTF